MLRREPWRDQFTARVGAPNIGDRERLHRLLDDILDRRWLTNHGPIERELEARLCEVTGTRHCIPVANATLGLMIAFRALDVQGDVLMPAFAFPALPHAATFLGLRPVFCDVDPHDHTVDVADVAARCAPDVGAVVGVHTWGRACDTEGLERVAGDRPVFYDAAPAFGCRHRGRPIGGNGHCEVFSFHATKLLNTFEGGAIATDDDELAERIRLMVNFGFSGRDRVDGLGINAKMSEIHAAMGLVSLELAPQLAAANAEHHARYREAFDGVDGIRLVTGAPEAEHLNYVVVEVDERSSHVTRDELLEVLATAGVDARRYFFPGCHRIEPYVSAPGGAPSLPHTDEVCRRVLQLPTGSSLSAGDVGRVARTVADAVGGATSA